jgi:HEAT repeat protein
VQHHIFRTQSREIFVNVEEAIQSGHPPLGFVADSLQGQQKWLDGLLSGLTPHTPVLRVADLAKAGLFGAVLTDAFDGLLLRAFNRVGVAFKEITVDSPGYGEGKALPVLREWDDRAFLDAQDHRSRENDFVRTRLAGMIDERSAILVVGQRPQWSDLNRAVVDVLKVFPALPVLWIEEPVGAEDTPVLEWMAEHLGAFTHVKVPSLPEYVEGLATALGVEKTPLVAPPPAKETLFQRVMNTSFDVKPVLIFVPGVALLGGLLNQLPKMTVGKALSLLAFAATIAGAMNYRERRAYFQQVDPVLDRLAAVKKQLDGSRDIQGLNQADALLSQAEAALAKVSVPAKSSFTLELLRERMIAHRAGVEGDLRKVRDRELTPRFFLHRQRERIEADPLQEALGSHPPLLVHEVTADALAAEAGTDPRGIYFQGRPLSDYRVARRLDAHRGASRLALLSRSALLLQVTLRKEILEDTRAGRIAVELDLSKGDGASLESKALDGIKEIAGYTGDRAALFRPDGVRALFQEGKCSFYFVHLDGAGVAGSMSKIEALLAQYPRCRAVISVSTRSGEVQLSKVAPSYRFLSAAEYPWPQALAYLRERTSPSFAERVVENNLLRWGLPDPLVLSSLVDHYRLLGSAPRSLASIYDRLLSVLLARSGGPSADRRTLLGSLAHERVRKGGPLERRRALEIAGKGDAGAALVDRLVADGVLRSLGDVQVDFVDQNVLTLCAATYASGLPQGERLSFLLKGGDDLLAFHAGIDPRASELAGQLLADYGEVDGLLRKRGRHLSLLNPRLPLLRKVAWVVQNGEVDPGHTRHLESLLFELTRHQDARVSSEAVLALSTLSTPAVRRWVIDGIEGDGPQDGLLLQVAARAPSDIYVGPIRGWYRRLGTDADRKKAGRFEEKEGESTGRFATSEAVANAFSALAQSGTADSLQFLEEEAASPGEPRFPPELVRSFRQHAARVLLSNGHHERVRPLLPGIARAPGEWLALLPELYALDDDAVVKAMADILGGPPAEDAAGKSAREYAAFVLSRVARASALPALTALLQRRREGPPDALPYAALSLGYRGDPADLPLVAGLIEDVRKRRKERPVDSDYTATLDRALALFSSPESFALFARLYDDPEWWGSGPKNLSVLPYFKGAGAEHFVLRRLLCERTSPPEESALVQALGRMRTPGAREALDGLLRAADGLENARTLGQICGDDGSKARSVLGSWTAARRRGISLALVQLQDERDLPRLLRWAADPDQDVRRAALDALGRVGGPGIVVAREALAESLVRSPEDRYHAIRSLGALGVAEGEGPLLSLLDAPDARTDWLVPALEKTGGWAAFLKLYAAQGKAVGPGRATPGAIASALFRIASRMVAEPLPVARFAGVIPG